MTDYPELIGGTIDRLDTEMMRAAKGRLISKVGAEGVIQSACCPVMIGQADWGCTQD